MHILHVIGSIARYRGGPVPAAAGMIALCDRLGYRSSVLTVQFPDEEHAFSATTTIHRMPPSFPARAMASRAAARWIEEHHADYDLIVLHETYSFAILQVGFRLCRTTTPFVLVPHASLHPSNLVRKAALKHLLGRTVIARMLHHTRAVWAASEMERSQLELFSAKPPTTVLPIPVEAPAQPGDRAAFRQRLGFGADELVVSFAGRFHHVKQPDLLIRAVALARVRQPRLRLVLAGAGEAAMEKHLRDLVAATGMTAFTTFTGFINAATRNDLLAGSDLFAMPSSWESFSVASVEAMQAGLPVLLSRHIGVGTEVEAAQAGWLSEPRLPEFARALEQIASSPTELARRAQNAGELGARFNPTRLLDSYSAAIAKSMGKSAGTAGALSA